MVPWSKPPPNSGVLVKVFSQKLTEPVASTRSLSPKFCFIQFAARYSTVVVMSIGDGARWLAAHVRSPEWFKPIVDLTTTRRASVGSNDIGLAWGSHESSGARFAWHNGGTGGFTSFLGVDRQAGVAVVVLSAVGGSPDDTTSAGFALLRQLSGAR